MPGFVLQANARCQCTHAAPATITPSQAPSQARVWVSKQLVATMDSQIAVAGCPFQIPTPTGPKSQPCKTVRWSMPSTRVLVGGVPAMLSPVSGLAPGVCHSAEQLPQGPPTVSAVQTRVRAT